MLLLLEPVLLTLTLMTTTILHLAVLPPGLLLQVNNNNIVTPQNHDNIQGAAPGAAPSRGLIGSMFKKSKSKVTTDSMDVDSSSDEGESVVYHPVPLISLSIEREYIGSSVSLYHPLSVT